MFFSIIQRVSSSAANQGEIVLSPWLAADEDRVSHMLSHVVWWKYIYIYIYIERESENERERERERERVIER